MYKVLDDDSLQKFLHRKTVPRRLMFCRGFRVFFSEKNTEKHSLESRLTTAGMTLEDFLEEVKNSIYGIRKDRRGKGMYLFKLKKCQILAASLPYKKTKAFQIVAILTAGNNDADYGAEYLADFFDISPHSDAGVLTDRRSRSCIVIERWDEKYEFMIDRVTEITLESSK